MVWFGLLLVLVVIFWIHYSISMTVPDRISAGQDVLSSTEFQPIGSFEEAVKEDPDLVGWICRDEESVILFRSQSGDDIREIVDISSKSFHPGLVIHYLNGQAVRTDAGEIKDANVQEAAQHLLTSVRDSVRKYQGITTNYDGWHY